MKDGRVYLGTENGDLYCINPADASFGRHGLALIPIDPSRGNGFVYTAAEDGGALLQGRQRELVWTFVTDGAHLGPQ
jgi:hypothetical protein